MARSASLIVLPAEMSSARFFGLNSVTPSARTNTAPGPMPWIVSNTFGASVEL